MPESKSKHHHKPAHPQPNSVNHSSHKNKKPVTVMIALALFIGVLGLGISYFISGNNPAALVFGGVVAVLIGLIFGYLINKNLSKK